MYFYLSDSGQLIIRLYGFDEEGRLITEKAEKQGTACDIKTIYGRTAVWVKSLALGHPYLELPTTVAEPFEKVLREKELKSLCLIPAGTSLLNGYSYYKLNIEIPEKWELFKQYFEYSGEVGDMQEYLTCYW